MTEYSDFPPLAILKKILRNCPKSTLLFLDLWKHRKDNKATFRVKDIRDKFLMSEIMFRNQLIVLARFELISIKKTQHHYQIEFHD